MAEDQISDVALLNRVKADIQRLALLGLIPEDGAKISARGEFIVDPSNVENDENKKMRSYRHKEFPKTLHAAHPDDADVPLTLTVRNREEETQALALGWSVDPLHGPSGRLEGGKAVAVEEVKEVREFAAPGQPQPFEAASAAPAKTPKAPAKAKTAKAKK